MIRSPAIALALWAVASSELVAATYYVDNTLAANCVAYDVAARSCGSTETAPALRTLGAALESAKPGDVIIVRGGNYQERLVPSSSGTAAQPITVKAFDGESPVLTGANEPAILLSAQSYWVIDGIGVDNAVGWGRLQDASHVIIRNGRYRRATASGTTGGFKLVRSNFNRLEQNVFESGTDNVVIQESDRNVVANNRFSEGRHSLLSLRCGSYNIIRGNHFSNSQQKAVEVYDCEGTSDAPVKLDATRRNLFDQNRFTLTLGAWENHRYNAMQYSGQQGIVRRNLFHDNAGGGINFQVYESEALHNYGHRVYNNSFVANDCHALAASSAATGRRYADILVRNNLLHGNRNCEGAAQQTDIRNSRAVQLAGNIIMNADPGFADKAARDLRLRAGSTVIDGAAFVAKARETSSGTVVTLDDAGWFSDGFGIPGETGDLVQFANQGERFRVVSIDYTTQQLTLDREASWTAGQGLHLAYLGPKPDHGALESGDDTALLPGR